jgi:hypothetical protein
MDSITTYVPDVSPWQPPWKRDYQFGVLLIYPPDPPLGVVNRLRDRYAWSQSADCDAHISLTVPLPRPVTRPDWAALQIIAAQIEPFEIRYGPLMHYLPAAPGVVLRIEPQDRLKHLLVSLEGSDCFAGARPRPYPFSAHMTIAELISEELTLQLMDELKDEAPRGAFVCDHVSYAVPDQGFRFTERARLALGQPRDGMAAP